LLNGSRRRRRRRHHHHHQETLDSTNTKYCFSLDEDYKKSFEFAKCISNNLVLLLQAEVETLANFNK